MGLKTKLELPKVGEKYILKRKFLFTTLRPVYIKITASNKYHVFFEEIGREEMYEIETPIFFEEYSHEKVEKNPLYQLVNL